MKKLTLLLSIIAINFSALAQLPSGVYAPAFTVYEIDKATGSVISDKPIVLYDLTDSGYTVFIDVFTTWCVPCWNYHLKGHFKNLDSLYGPQGTDEVRVMGMECMANSYSSLIDWLDGVNYPVIPLAMPPNTDDFVQDYNIIYYPTIYMICPNRLVYELNQLPTGKLYNASCNCPHYDNTLDNNALIVGDLGLDNIYFCTFSATPAIKLQNVGNNTLTSARLSIVFDGQTSTYDWSGSLTKYGTTMVTLPQVISNVEGVHNLSVTISEVNGEVDTDTVMNIISSSFTLKHRPTSTTLEEDFLDGIPSDWFVDDGELSAFDLSGNHGNAVLFNSFNIEEGSVVSLFLPFEDLSNIINSVLSFDVAHKRKDQSNVEKLRVLYSSDCGNTWNSIFNKAGSMLMTVSDMDTVEFFPSDDEWRTETIDLSSITHRDNVAFKFEFYSKNGNNIWIDNVMITGDVGIDDNIGQNSPNLEVYPNPATGVVKISSHDNVLSVELFDMQGGLVMTQKGSEDRIDLNNLPNGIYTMKIKTEAGDAVRKIVKK